MIYVRQSMDPGWKIEVEAVALAPERQANKGVLPAAAANGRHG
jgi:hypothetical protein